jgi:hypothetical protein
MTLLGILGMVAALAFGIYWGMPVRYNQRPEEIEERLEKDGRHQKVKRHTTFLNLLQRKVQKGSDRRRTAHRSRRPFQY